MTMHDHDEEIRRAVKTMAASVKPPGPPAGLRVAGVHGRRRFLPLAAGLVVAAAAVAMFAYFRPRPAVVVEFLRMDGRSVAEKDLRIFSLPGADAVVVKVDRRSRENSRFGVEKKVNFAGVQNFLLPDLALAGLSGREKNPGLPVYHVRLFRARAESGFPGSALFRPEEDGKYVPISEMEAWGNPQQLLTLQEALEANTIESVPGLIIASSRIGFEDPFSFEITLGETFLQISFQGEQIWAGQHRVHLRVRQEEDGDLLEAQLVVQNRQTTALVAPLPGSGEQLVFSVTPLFGGGANDSPDVDILWLDQDSILPPERISYVLPIYPEMAKKLHLDGDVILQVVVRKSGSVDGIVVFKMPEGGEALAGSAVDAVSKWKYKPARENGQPINVFFTIVMKYYIED